MMLYVSAEAGNLLANCEVGIFFRPIENINDTTVLNDRMGDLFAEEEDPCRLFLYLNNVCYFIARKIGDVNLSFLNFLTKSLLILGW